jgi:hypothetical protein
MAIMYSLASLPLIYVFSFGPNSELVGVIVFFIVNVIVCFVDVILDFVALFSQIQNTGATSVSGTSRVVGTLRVIVGVLFPSVNFKHSLYNIRLRSNEDCLTTTNSLMLTNYTSTEPWLSVSTPGLGVFFILFCVQIAIWLIILTLIENRGRISLGCRQCCNCDKDLQESPNVELIGVNVMNNSTFRSQCDDESEPNSFPPTAWNDSVRTLPSSALLVRENPPISILLSSCSISITMFEVNGDLSCKRINPQQLQSSSFGILFSDSRSPRINNAAMESSQPSTISTFTLQDKLALVFSVRSFSLFLHLETPRSLL